MSIFRMLPKAGIRSDELTLLHVCGKDKRNGSELLENATSESYQIPVVRYMN